LIESFSAQLCGAVATLPDNPDSYVVEEKFDGVRGLVVFDKTSEVGDLQIWNRSGQNKGRLLNTPGLRDELVNIAEALPSFWDGTVLDGELVAETWNQTMHLLGGDGQTESGLKFIVFDIPYFEGQDMREYPWSMRRRILESVLTKFTTNDTIIQISKLLPKTLDEVMEIWERGGEGVVIKLIDAAYYGGSRNYWFKLKANYTAEGVISRFTPGGGKYSDTFGAVVISQYFSEGLLHEVSQMSGMTDAVRRGFDPIGDIGRVIEFKHYGKTVEKRYRHPQWLRFRDDKGPEDCSWEASEG
jgi:ATP-dependent DNA ligase